MTNEHSLNCTSSNSRPKLLLRTTASRQADGRQRITHKPHLLSALRGLSLEARLRKNQEIEKSNNEVYLRNLSKGGNDTPSPTASLITISEEEFEGIRSTKTLFERVKDSLPAYILSAMQQINSLESTMRDKRPREENQVSEQPVPKNRRLMPPIIEKSYNHLTPHGITIPDCLYAVAKHNSYLPLPIFTERNLTYIHVHAASFETSKVLIDGIKQEVITLQVLLDSLGISQSLDRHDEGLTYPQFQQAAKNYYLFETERDPSGEKGTRSIWTRNHFLFFTQQPETEQYYDLWKPRELDFRRDRQLYSKPFTLSSYELCWENVRSESRKQSATHFTVSSSFCSDD
ncbi:hypothetical protein F5878DRAFT_611419 [Lentinula raphanica]|uniref:Uncharacterized protein n=1 Tax=Lentinula raphanica TaxID=153919 RepID=A0AA38PE52_9AGAR|nr:hypothetical protein F5878DRAFT_611419 [Lentinula raphanica]